MARTHLGGRTVGIVRVMNKDASAALHILFSIRDLTDRVAGEEERSVVSVSV